MDVRLEGFRPFCFYYNFRVLCTLLSSSPERFVGYVWYISLGYISRISDSLNLNQCIYRIKFVNVIPFLSVMAFKKAVFLTSPSLHDIYNLCDPLQQLWLDIYFEGLGCKHFIHSFNHKCTDEKNLPNLIIIHIFLALWRCFYFGMY